MQIFLPIAELPVDLFLVVALGAAVGFISGLFGIGGGFLMTPLLIFLGIPPAVAVATGAMQIAASSTTGTLNYLRRKMIDVRLALVMTAGGFIGSLLGVLFFNQMRRLGQLDLVIQLSYVTLMLSIGSLMLVDVIRSILRDRSKKAPVLAAPKSHWAADLPLLVNFPRSGMQLSIIPILTLGTVIGFLGAVMGIGGGFMTIPALIYILRMPPSLVVGTSMLQIVITMLAATLMHAVGNGSVDVLLGLLLTVGGVIGAQFGTRAGQNLRSGPFRLLLALLVLAVGIRFAVELLSTPQEFFSILPGNL